MHISLLRLQEIWLGKFITTGLVIPGVALLRNKLPKASGAIVGKLGIYMTYVLMSSGHLPLMKFVLLLAFFLVAPYHAMLRYYLGVVLPHLPVGKKTLRFCLV